MRISELISIIVSSIALIATAIFSIRSELRQKHRFKIELKYIDKSAEYFIFKLNVYNKSVNEFTISEVKINGYAAQFMNNPPSQKVLKPNGVSSLWVFCDSFDDSIPFKVELSTSLKTKKRKYKSIIKLDKAEFDY